MPFSREDADRHCRELVSQADKERFLASLFAPDDVRPHLLALYAFDAEVARLRAATKEPMLGEIRLQWWADSLDELYAGRTADHPVLQALARAIEAARLPQSAFAACLEGRRFDLFDDPMPSLAYLEGYLGETSSAMVQLATLVLAGGEGAAEAAGYAGVARGITGVLLSQPAHRARGQCYLPRDVLARHGLEPAHVLSGRMDAAMAAVIGELIDVAERRLAEARAAGAPKAALPAFLAAGLSDLHLRALRKAGAQVLTRKPETALWRRQAALWWRARRDRF